MVEESKEETKEPKEQTKKEGELINQKQNSGGTDKKTPGVSANHDEQAATVCSGEPMLLMLKRWKKIANDYSLENGRFDISKLPEVCDNIKFDLLHNPELASDFRMVLLAKSQ